MGIEVCADPAVAWNNEYMRQGIPSSRREEPSRVLRWALANLPFLTDNAIRSAVDLGCGTGRNAMALVEAGADRVDGLDFSATALKIARARETPGGVTFIEGNMTKPLPFEDNSFDFAVDIFAYFHQLTDIDRINYRREIHRILKPGAILLISIATDMDGYYSSCGPGPLRDIESSVRLTWDPVAEVGNILLSPGELAMEFADTCTLQMSWVKRKQGIMHGRPYMRETAATLWMK